MLADSVDEVHMGDCGGRRGRHGNHGSRDKRPEAVKRSGQPSVLDGNGIPNLPNRTPVDFKSNEQRGIELSEQRCQGKKGRCGNNRGKISSFCDGCRCSTDGCTEEKDLGIYCKRDRLARMSVVSAAIRRRAPEGGGIQD